MNENAVKEIIKRYKDHLREHGLVDELYKWKLLGRYRGRPAVGAANLEVELNDIDFANLIYHMAIRTATHMVQVFPERYRDCLKLLFDENLPLHERIIKFTGQVFDIYKEILPNESFSTHHDERTAATFLTYHNPDKYTFYKSTLYQKFCKQVGVNTKKKNEKYVHYLELVDDLIENYIKKDEELTTLFRAALPDGVFEDQNYKILAQDILYLTMDKQITIARNYWRLGTTDNAGTSYWAFMEQHGKIAVGWSELEDLGAVDVQSKEDIKQLMKKAGSYRGDNRMLSRKAGEVFDFFNHINDGDVILAQDGADVLGIGIVEDGDYHYEATDGFPHQKEVKWHTIRPNIKNKQGLLTSVYKLSDMSLIRDVDQLLTEPGTIKNQPMPNMKNKALNQILFGPPGTGKTYHTINKSLEIINPEFDFSQPREAIRAEFERLVDAGQIVFSTFHQSMSYEDFVEGIKPVEPGKDGDPVIYRIDYGVFRKLCVEAAFDIARSKENKTTEEVLDFSIQYDNFVETIEERLTKEEEVTLATKTGGEVVVEGISEQGNFIIKHQQGTRSYTVSKSRLTKLNSAIENLEDVNNINDQFREVIGGSNSSAYWSVFNAIRKEKPTRTKSKENRIFTFEEKKQVVLSLVHSDYKNQAGKPYVLIIDEINRGNVSQVFGELITLIEEDKRQGRAEALEVVLPYSKEKFGVPANLYIIGTMNTADRSVEALDTALRRRFSFVEMPPVPSVIKTHGKLKEEEGKLEIDGYPLDLEHLLTIINERIEILLDRDHLIGHSYFMMVDNKTRLKEAFAKNIIPLLQEYFYGDYGKISLVLGEGFCIGESAENKKFAQAKNYDSSYFNEKMIYTIPDVMKEDFDVLSAIKKLFNEIEN